MDKPSKEDTEVAVKALVVIPTYNEIENVRDIVTAVLNTDERLHVLVVDDNSPDGTGAEVQRMQQENDRILLLERPAKNGLGTAYCEGFAIAIEKGYEFVFEMDADFSHDPAMLPVFLKEIETHDLIIGSRYSDGVNVVNWPMSRLLLSYFANIYTRIITGMPIKDATGGFKCFRTDILRKVDLTAIKSNGYAFQIEMNYKVWRNGARIKEIPIVFVDRRSGVSKMSKNIIYEAAGLVWKLKFRTLLRLPL